MRLIDADALSEKLCETTIFIKDGEAFQRMINDAPTVDAVELVRCKDCKHWHREIHNGIEYFNFSSCDLNRYGDGHDFYCADGERREP